MSRRTLLQKNRRGQGLVEYIIIVAAVALIALASLSMFGHKVADQYAIGAGMLPGAHGDDNNPIATGFYADITDDGAGNNTGNGVVTWDDVTGNATVGEMDNNVMTPGGARDTPDNSGDAFVAE